MPSPVLHNEMCWIPGLADCQGYYNDEESRVAGKNVARPECRRPRRQQHTHLADGMGFFVSFRTCGPCCARGRAHSVRWRTGRRSVGIRIQPWFLRRSSGKFSKSLTDNPGARLWQSPAAACSLWSNTPESQKPMRMVEDDTAAQNGNRCWRPGKEGSTGRQ